jgi:superfamily II DNA or RNA helicase
MSITPHQAKYFALELAKRSASDSLEKYGAVLADAKVDLQPHQVDAALFAFQSPLSKGAILADEVGLGKTIEAGLVLSQLWATDKRRLLIICPAHLRKQWATELEEKFYLPAVVLGSKSFNEQHKAGTLNPFEQKRVVVCSYNFVANRADYVEQTRWDLVVMDEAHRLRNVWKPSAKTARAVADATHGVRKLLLTATPLQNNLTELYGLVGIIDPHVFGDLDSFRAQFTRRDSPADLKDLRDRIQHITHRTLRQHVQEYIRFPERVPVTLTFEPTQAEQELYTDVTAFLQRQLIHSLPQQQRHLITIILRKLLASSTFAIGRTLDALVQTLDRAVRSSIPQEWGADLGEELDDLDDFLDEYGADIHALDISVTPDDLKEVGEEINELKRLRDKAIAIELNAKGEKLLTGLEEGFKELRKLGAPEKAIIFTESTRTQEYLFKKLQQGPFAGRVVLFNGSNKDPQSRATLEEWTKRHAGSGQVSQEKEANMRAALVEEFRERAQIMIATEAGAEGINLQFCSLVINYDLPWNPQRVEQRIGRCHRYGQKHNVVVVNFLNQKNAADQRVLQLLGEKFNLFSGVFGASDEVLGAVESGMDIERSIAEIYQKCKTTDQINAAFDDLQKVLDAEIKARLKKTRHSLLEHFDVDVINKLRMTKADSHVFLQRVEKWLWQLSMLLLKGHARFDAEQLRFTLNASPFDHEVRAGLYGLRRDDDEATHLRLNHPLTKGLLKQARALETPSAELRFDMTNNQGRVGALDGLQGKRGTLLLTKVEVKSLETTDHLLFTAVTDDGTVLKQEQCRKLMELPALASPEPVAIDTTALAKDHERLLQGLGLELKAKDTQHVTTEVLKLNRWAQDRQNTADRHLRDTKEKIQQLNRDSATITEPTEHLKLQKKLRDYESRLRKQRAEIDRVYDKIEQERDKMIRDIEGRTKRTVTEEPIFTVRFSIH